MTKKAYLAMGCFWGPDDYFSKLEGVSKTQVGYSGGEFENPSYHVIGDSSETIEIEFDPKIISYKEILEHFFKEHDPWVEEESRYRSVIFYLNEDQKAAAKKAVKVYEKGNKRKVATEIEKFRKFTLAEDYHQKYFQKNGRF